MKVKPILKKIQLKSAIKRTPFVGRMIVAVYRKLSSSPPGMSQSSRMPLYEMNHSTLVINHTAGVFSCYTIRLEAILDYYRTYQRLPSIVDSSRQFVSYKKDLQEDISNHFFETKEDLQIPFNGKLIYLTSGSHEQQFSDYSKLNYADITPFVEKYFAPSASIREQVKRLEGGLPWPYQSICGIRYRGTDKSLETNQPSYAEFVVKAVKLKQKFPQVKFVIQTDEQDFLERFVHKLGDDCCFHIGPLRNKLGQISDYVAEIIILSRCKYLITTSGNGELWIRIFRGTNKGSVQWLSPKECIYGIKNKDFDPNKKNFWIDNEKLVS